MKRRDTDTRAHARERRGGDAGEKILLAKQRSRRGDVGKKKIVRVLARVGSRRKKDFIKMHASDFSLILALIWCNICALYVCFIHISCLFANS